MTNCRICVTSIKKAGKNFSVLVRQMWDKLCLLVSDVMHDLSMFEGLTLRAGPRMATLHPGLKVRILFLSIEAGAVLVDIGQVAVAEDPGIWMFFLQAAQQPEKGALLPRCAGVGGGAVFVQATFVAHA